MEEGKNIGPKEKEAQEGYVPLCSDLTIIAPHPE
jgi:hypothetical protein